MIYIDATIVTCRSDKQDAAGTWKRTFGFHPLVAIDTERREVLAQMIRPGNAGSNTAIDHVQVSWAPPSTPYPRPSGPVTASTMTPKRWPVRS